MPHKCHKWSNGIPTEFCYETIWPMLLYNLNCNFNENERSGEPVELLDFFFSKSEENVIGWGFHRKYLVIFIEM